MAKEQNLSLNPTKISGVCGRLMCCLKNEEETYEELNKKLPNVGDFVLTTDGQRGEVQSVNVLRQLVKVLVEVGDDKELKEFEVDKLRFHKHHGKKGQHGISPEELKELEKLVQEDAGEMEAVELTAQQQGPGRENGGRQGLGHADGRERRARQDKGERPNKKDNPEKGKNRQNRSKDFEKGKGHQDKPEHHEKRNKPGRHDKQDRPEKQGAERQGRNRGGDNPRNNKSFRGRQQGGNREKHGGPRGDREKNE